MQGIESFAVEGTYKPLEFTYTGSDPLGNGHLWKEGNTCGVIFVADKIITTGVNAGCRDTLDVENGEIGVLVYNCEAINVPVAGLVILPGEAIYWDGVHGNGVTNVFGSGVLWIGICKVACGATDTQVLIDLHGNHPLAEEAP